MQPQLWVTLPLVRTDWTTCTDPLLRYTYIHVVVTSHEETTLADTQHCVLLYLTNITCLSTTSVPQLVQVDGALATLTLRRLMSYIYGAPILDVSRSHTTTQHSR